MIKDDERYWANMVIGVIDNLERPMLMYEGEKMIVRKALKAYLEANDSDSEKPNNCETCKWWEEDTSFCYSKADSDDHACHYESKESK